MQSLNRTELSNWTTLSAENAAEEGSTGPKISQPGYDDSFWPRAVVPGSVLASLVDAGVYPDPWFGDNSKKIPDISVTGRDAYTYWFRSQFGLPTLGPAQRVWLELRGVNYGATVFVNGSTVTPSGPVKGMFLRHRFDITKLARGDADNAIAVLVEPPDNPGTPEPPPGGQGGDHKIAKDVTAQFFAGWDWIIAMPDRSTGLWDKVFVEVTGPVRLRDPHIVVKVPGVRVPGEAQKPVTVEVFARLQNGSDSDQTVELRATLDGQTIRKPVTVAAGTLSDEQSVGSIQVDSPRLWWPSGLGEQALYDLKLEVEIDGAGLSDCDLLSIGLREVGSDDSNGAYSFSVNGQPVFIRGGNWIAADAMMRWTAQRYDDAVRLHRDAGLNFIRVWGGGITERPEFYAACDRYGLLVMQEFWITGDCNGRWGGFDSYPQDHDLWLRSAFDAIRMLRNHPSLLFWCGGNEYSPPNKLDSKLREAIEGSLDGTRIYISSSTVTRPSSVGLSLSSGDGPYGIHTPEAMFGSLSKQYPFNPELGSVGTPVVESIRRMFPPAERRGREGGKPPTFPYCPEGTNSETYKHWDLHKYIPYSNPGKGVVFDQIDTYGQAQEIEDFCERAQLANYQQYQALFEGRNSRMWQGATGIVLWKSQNPWTGLRGQLYDCYHAQTAGLFGSASANEPVHVQLNRDDNTLGLVNNLPKALSGVVVKAQLFGLDGKKNAAPISVTLDVPANSFVRGPKLPDFTGPSKAYFGRLEARDAENALLSRNFYWLLKSPNSDYSELAKLVRVKPEATFTMEVVDGEQVLSVRLSLPSDAPSLAFFLRLQLHSEAPSKDKDTRILPGFYSDNYVSLMPGEERSLTLRCAQQPGAASLQLWIGGFNSDPFRAVQTPT